MIRLKDISTLNVIWAKKILAYSYRKQIIIIPFSLL